MYLKLVITDPLRINNTILKGCGRKTWAIKLIKSIKEYSVSNTACGSSEGSSGLSSSQACCLVPFFQPFLSLSLLLHHLYFSPTLQACAFYLFLPSRILLLSLFPPHSLFSFACLSLPVSGEPVTAHISQKRANPPKEAGDFHNGGRQEWVIIESLLH